MNVWVVQISLGPHSPDYVLLYKSKKQAVEYAEAFAQNTNLVRLGEMLYWSAKSMVLQVFNDMVIDGESE
jgi:hypothetical protein